MSDEIYQYDSSDFYRTLITRYRKQAESVQEQGGIICVPLHGVNDENLLNLNFIQIHLFVPSPFFKDQYNSISQPDQLKLIVDEQSESIRLTSKNAKIKSQMKILSEQDGYTSNFKAYKLFLIDCPIIRTDNEKTKSTSFANINYIAPLNVPMENQKLTVEDVSSFGKSVEFLQTLATSLADEFYNDIRLFNKTYIILPNYFDECIEKMSALYKAYAYKFRKYNKIQKDEILSISIENYMNGFLYAKIWQIIVDTHKDEDQLIDYKIGQLKKLTKSSMEKYLKLDRKYFIEFKQALAELAKMDKLQSAYEKLYCMKTCNDYVSSELVLYHKNQANGNDPSSELKLTSDELLPLTCYILIKTDFNNYASLLYYLENFNFTFSCPAFESINASSNNEFSFVLSTFKAAVNMLRTYS
jgi:hypothetical protein